MSITARQLAAKLLASKNPDAVVVLSVEGFTYSSIDEFVIDESQRADKDGVIGNVLLHVVSDSDIGQFLDTIKETV